MMIVVRLRMPTPLQFVRMTTSILGLDRRPKGLRARSFRPIIPYRRVLASETAVARVAGTIEVTGVGADGDPALSSVPVELFPP
jgi:hypothetical protein